MFNWHYQVFNKPNAIWLKRHSVQSYVIACGYGVSYRIKIFGDRLSVEHPFWTGFKKRDYWIDSCIMPGQNTDTLLRQAIFTSYSSKKLKLTIVSLFSRLQDYFKAKRVKDLAVCVCSLAVPKLLNRFDRMWCQYIHNNSPEGMLYKLCQNFYVF